MVNNMTFGRFCSLTAMSLCAVVLSTTVLWAQAPAPDSTTDPAGQQPEPPVHDHAAMMAAQDAHGWQVMWDGVVFATGNFQGSARGENQFRSQNWLMLMAHHPVG